eukprot:m.33465 g.33465  ORF g.33465 m.33465 type:complete len:426 (-) comp9623_c0_seq1:228-1505(-)
MQAGAWEAIKLVVLSVACVLFGVGNNVSFVEMGARMSDYPMFLLYFTTACYSTLYLLLAISQWTLDRRDPESPMRSVSLSSFILARPYQKTFFWLGFWLIVNGLCSQFSDTHVNGDLQSVLYQLTLPATGVLAYFMLGDRLTFLNILGTVFVLGGCLMVALPPLIQEAHSSNSTTSTTTTTTAHPLDFGASATFNVVNVSDDQEKKKAEWVWIIIFAISVIPNGVCAVLQEGLFHKHKEVNTALLLFWSNAYTLLGYLLALPLTMIKSLGGLSGHEIALNQRDAFRCIAEVEPLPPGCRHGAIGAVLAFVVCYLGFFLTLALLVKQMGAVFEALVNGVVTPASAVAFTMKWLVGSDVEPLTGWVIAAIIVVPGGVVVFKWPEIVQFIKAQCGNSSKPLLDLEQSGLQAADSDDKAHEGQPLLSPA